MYSPICTFENGFQCLDVPLFQRVEDLLQLFNESPELVRERSGREQNVAPDMKRTGRKTCQRFPSWTGKLGMIGVNRKQGGKDLRQMADLGHQSVVIFCADDMRDSS